MSSKRYKKLPEKTRDLQSESLDKLIPILKQNCTTKFDESVDLSFKNENFNTDDDRYSANSNWGIPAFYVPKDNWSHTYKSFSNSISGLGSFKFYYDNGKYLDYRF